MTSSSRFRSVALIIFYDLEGRILLQDRKNISKRGEAWGYFGGGIEEGETPKEAMVRETKEELDYTLGDFISIGIIRTSDDRGTIERHVFLAKMPSPRAFTQMEGDGMRLFSLEEAKRVKKIFGDDQVIARLQEMGWPPSESESAF